MSNEVFKNDTTITLNHDTITGANLYHVQVALDPDFVTMVINNLAVATATHVFTDGSENNKKRWWRWRYSTNAGSTWSAWSDVGSYWLNTAGGADVSVANDKWKLFAEDDSADYFDLTAFPIYLISPIHIEHNNVRNREGELLSDYVATKETIQFEFEGMHVIPRELYRQIFRYHIQHKTFFLACKIWNGVDYVANVWLVQLQDNPELKLAATSRNDYFEGKLKFEEV